MKKIITILLLLSQMSFSHKFIKTTEYYNNIGNKGQTVKIYTKNSDFKLSDQGSYLIIGDEDNNNKFNEISIVEYKSNQDSAYIPYNSKDNIDKAGNYRLEPTREKNGKLYVYKHLTETVLPQVEKTLNIDTIKNKKYISYHLYEDKSIYDEIENNNIKGIISRSSGDMINDKIFGLGINAPYEYTPSRVSNFSISRTRHFLSLVDVYNGKKVKDPINDNYIMVNAIGNYPNDINISSVAYNNMSPFSQEFTRIPYIMATSNSKHDRSFEDYSDFGYLRSMGISTKEDVGSTSAAAPTISSYLYLIKEKYPWMSWHQVKETLLTTATPYNKQGYLDNVMGWGIANIEKALKGPAQFNAGLIDENRFYNGNYEKIYDVKGNTYFYADIPENEEVYFSNDITSGLTGDSRKGRKIKDDYKYYLRNKYFLDISNLDLQLTNNDTYLEKIKDIYNKNKNITLHYTRVLESEKRFYKDQAEAGLRKAGKGILILEGKQLYNAHTQVLEGILVLTNKTNSTYEIVEDATMLIDGNNIHIKDIKVAGTLILKGNNIVIDNLTKLKNGKIIIQNENNEIITIKNYTATKVNPKVFKGLGLKVYNYEEQNIELDDIMINPTLSEAVYRDELFEENVGDFKNIQKINNYKAIKDNPYKFDLMQFNQHTNSFDEYSYIDEDLYDILLNMNKERRQPELTMMTLHAYPLRYF